MKGKSRVAKSMKADVFSEKCPSREILSHVTSTWGSLILVLLINETLRFSELRDKIGGISEKMLAQTLRTLEEDGFIMRRSYPVIPPKVEYSLTALGHEGALHIRTLTRWIENHLQQIKAVDQSRRKSGS